MCRGLARASTRREMLGAILGAVFVSRMAAVTCGTQTCAKTEYCCGDVMCCVKTGLQPLPICCSTNGVYGCYPTLTNNACNPATYGYSGPCIVCSTNSTTPKCQAGQTCG